MNLILVAGGIVCSGLPDKGFLSSNLLMCLLGLFSFDLGFAIGLSLYISVPFYNQFYSAFFYKVFSTIIFICLYQADYIYIYMDDLSSLYL